jgi:hypothetical protein
MASARTVTVGSAVSAETRPAAAATRGVIAVKLAPVSTMKR